MTRPGPPTFPALLHQLATLPDAPQALVILHSPTGAPHALTSNPLVGGPVTDPATLETLKRAHAALGYPVFEADVPDLTPFHLRAVRTLLAP